MTFDERPVVQSMVPEHYSKHLNISKPISRWQRAALENKVRESLAAPGAFAGTAAVRCDVAASAITGAKLLRNGLENVIFTGR